MSLLLKNALIIDPKSSQHKKESNILIKDGVIESIGASKADQVIDCSGKMISAGWFDLNANFCDPGYEFKEDLMSGTQTAARGGFTDVHLVPITDPVIQNKSDVEYLTSSTQPEVDLHISASVSDLQGGKNLTEILDLFHYGARSFSDGDQPIWNTELLLKALQYTASLDVPIIQNARDIHLASNTHMHEGFTSTLLGLRGEPSLSEALTVSRDLDILRYSGGKLHFTKISSSTAVDLIRQAKNEGLNVTCDVSIFHLLFTEENINDFDSIYKSKPPYRTVSDQKALFKGLKDGTIDAICSNHRPQDQESKQLEFDLAEAGAISLQTFYPSLLKTKLPIDLAIEKITHGPRKILGLSEVTIDEGNPAKLTVFDPNAEWEFNGSSNESKSTNSPYWGKQLKGKVVATINRETLTVVEDAEV